MARSEISVSVDTEQFAAALDIIAKHARACADELRAARSSIDSATPDGPDEVE